MMERYWNKSKFHKNVHGVGKEKASVVLNTVSLVEHAPTTNGEQQKISL